MSRKFINNKFLKKYLSDIMPLLSKIDKAFGYSASGYYFSIVEIISSYPNFKFSFSDMNKLSRSLKVPKKKLLKFIELASVISDENKFTLFSSDRDCFWLNFKGTKSRKSRKEKCGRKKISPDDSMDLDSISSVNITLKQYQKLLVKYGELFVKKALEIFDSWLLLGSRETIKYINKNNYGHFRADGWLIYETKVALGVADEL